MLALKIRAPAIQNLFEPAIGQIRCSQLLRDIGQTDAIYSAIEYVHDAIEDKLPFNFDGKCFATLLELPCINCTGRSVPDIDTGMLRQIMRCLWQRMPGEIIW